MEQVISEWDVLNISVLLKVLISFYILEHLKELEVFLRSLQRFANVFD